MDMKKILQAIDGGAVKRPAESSDMKKFLSIVNEGVGSSNTLTTAENMVMQEYAEPVQKAKLKTSINKYVESVHADIKEEADRQHAVTKAKASDLAKRITAKMLGESVVAEESELDFEEPETSDPVDTVTVDIPLIIRLLEYAREDAKTDMDLHNVAEKLIELSKSNDTLSMDSYDAIVGEQEALPAPDDVNENELEESKEDDIADLRDKLEYLKSLGNIGAEKTVMDYIKKINAQLDTLIAKQGDEEAEKEKAFRKANQSTGYHSVNPKDYGYDQNELLP